MDEKTRRELEQKAIARQDREREERRKREEMERRRRDEDHNRFRMQQMAIEKQQAAKKAEEIKITQKNESFLNELEKKQEEERLRTMREQISQYNQDNQ